MEIEEANENREKRKVEVREFLAEADLLEFVEAMRSVFGPGVGLDWVKYGDRYLGRDAYEQHCREARASAWRLAKWKQVTPRWGVSTESQNRASAKGSVRVSRWTRRK